MPFELKRIPLGGGGVFTTGGHTRPLPNCFCGGGFRNSWKGVRGAFEFETIPTREHLRLVGTPTSSKRFLVGGVGFGWVGLVKWCLGEASF